MQLDHRPRANSWGWYHYSLCCIVFLWIILSAVYLNHASPPRSWWSADQNPEQPGVVERYQSNCPACGFEPINSATSSRRDVILAASLTALKRVEYFLRTLRTTGCRARVILFLDAVNTATPEWCKFFTACDIEPVFIGNTSSILAGAPKLSRYYYYYQWLKVHGHEVDRVLHTDTFDVIFQSDPFLPEINASKLYFTFEPVSIGSSRWTLSWLHQCYGSEPVRTYGDRLTSCSGVTIGGAKPFMTYLQVLLSSPDWRACYGGSLDQAHHNHLMYTGAFARAGIEIDELRCHSSFLTMHFCCKRYSCNYTDYVQVADTRAPVLVHQYNRWKNLTKRNKLLCPDSASIFPLTSSFRPAALEYLPPIEWELPTKLISE